MAGKGKENYLSGKRKRDGGLSLFTSDEEDSTNGVFLNDDFGPNLKDKAESKTPSSIPFDPKKEERDEEHYKPFPSKYDGVSVGTWARVRRGKYMGDLAQVVHVNKIQMKATVKLLPRLDLQAVANKFIGGVSANQYTSPAPRLITSSELDGYRARVKHSLDPDTGDLYEVFEGMKLKDGYVFKKLALDSLSFCFSNSNPSEAELIKFMPDENKESNDVNGKQTMNNDNDNVGDGFLSSDMENGFEVPDVVTHSHMASRIVIGSQKDDRNKVLEKGTDGPVVGTIEARLLKKAVSDKKSNSLDHHKKTISMKDTVRVLKGPLEGGKSDASGLGGQSGCSEPEPPPEASRAAGYEGLREDSFAEKLMSGAQELGGLMEEAATRCLGKTSLEDQLRGALLELELCKERVSAVEAERDTFCNSLKEETKRVSAVEAERDNFCNSLKEERERVSVVEAERDNCCNSLKEERERVSAVEAERDTFCNSLKEEREKMVSVLSRLLDTEVQLVTSLKEDLRAYEADV